jgi:hypothetical protein
LGCRHRLCRTLAAFTGRFDVSFDLLAPEPANSSAILGRMIRYGYFNPTRAGLVDDPFAWPWSSLRDLVGATDPSWTPLSRVASALRLPAARALRALTRTGDFCPRPPTVAGIAAASFDAIGEAVASALRLTDVASLSTPTARRLIVQACYEIGAPRPSNLAQHLGICIRSVQRARAPRHPALDAVLTALGDPRLRRSALDLRDLSPRAKKFANHGV